MTGHFPSGVNLSIENFERHLFKDGLFVEYFNDFLNSHVFSKKIQYNYDQKVMYEVTTPKEKFDEEEEDNLEEKRNNNINEVEGTDKHLLSKLLIQWCKTNRLPYFLRSKLYLEYKLCKKLIRKLDNRHRSAALSSRLGLGAYSISTPTSATISNKSKAFNMPRRPATQLSFRSWPMTKDEYTGFVSRAVSLPSLPLDKLYDYLDQQDYLEDVAFNQEYRQNRPYTSIDRYTVGNRTDVTDIEVELANLDFAEDDGRQSVLEFEKTPNDEEKDAERSVAVGSARLQLSFEELKETLLGSMAGMERFRNFISGTSGIHLYQFWLDTESYKDQVQCWQESSERTRELRVKLFRVMQDKYRIYLTADAKDQIKRALQDEGITQDLFARAQYDVLRRLRSYWLPRFVVHMERQSNDSNEDLTNEMARSFSSLSFFPTISVVKVLPILGHVVTEETREHPFESLVSFRESRIRSGLNTNASKRLNKESYYLALVSERDCGSPFTDFVRRSQSKEILHLLLFWLDVEDFMKKDEKTEDRLYRLYNAWTIFNKYIAKGDETSVSNSKQEIERIMQLLTNAKEITQEITIQLFGTLQARTAVKLKPIWELYNKEDRLEFVRYTKEPSVISQGAPHRHVKNQKLQYSPTRWVRRNLCGVEQYHDKTFVPQTCDIKTARYPGSTESVRRQRLQTALSMAEECNASRQSSRRSPEEKPKKKKGKKKRKKGVKFKTQEKSMKDSDDDSENEEEENWEETSFESMMENKGVSMAFKQYIQNQEGRDMLNSLLLYLDIDAYTEIHPSKKLPRQQQAMMIYRTYFDPSSRRAVLLPDDLVDKVEGERPSSPLLSEAKEFVLPELKAIFRTFFKANRANLLEADNKDDKDNNDIRSTAEGSHKTGTAESFYSQHSLHLNSKLKRPSRRKGTGRLQPTKEDRTSFIQAAQGCSGKLTFEMELFRRYLIEKDEPEGFPRLEKDLLFYLEVQKFKELHPYLDEASLNRKVEVIIDVFLDSATPPWLQIDINSELASKVIFRAQQVYAMGKRVPRDQKDIGIFDDAQNQVLKELLPYWAAFFKQRNTEVEETDFPLTRIEKELRKRFREFQNFVGTEGPIFARPETPGLGDSKHEMTFSISRGVKWKEVSIDLESVLSEDTAISKSTRTSRKSSQRTVDS